MKVELTVKMITDIIDKLECKFRQATLLTCSDFIVFKGSEIEFNTLYVRFDIKFKAHALPFILKSHYQ